jgi:hypothetical protein
VLTDPGLHLSTGPEPTFTFLRALLLLILLPCRSENRLAQSAHQAPTLIGCKFLKIGSRSTPFATSCCPVFSASLRLQQRSEIMQSVSRFVNSFFASPPSAANPAAARLSPLRAPSLTGRRILGQPVRIRKGFPAFFHQAVISAARRYLTASALAGTAAPIAAYPASLG